MKRQISIWKFIKRSIEENIPVMLLYVLESSGSSPGRQGFFMAVNANKEMEGSIGGGIMEHKFVEMAGEQLQEIRNKKQEIRNEKVAAQIKQQVHDKSAVKNQSGMICSGEQTILIYRIREKDILHIEKIIVSLEQNKNGTLHLSPQGILFEDALPVKDFEFNLKSEEDWNYTEKIGYKNHLYIIGGGHCALAFSKLMNTMDFYIHLFEDREGLNTMGANNYVHEKKVVKDYSELAQLIPPGENNYVVVMTFGYRTDDIAVRALISKSFKYFGLLGSKKKIEKMFTDYKEEGINEEALKRIHSPIGIQIKSETPEEIAVSIAAEIIKVKNIG
ncbi:MAG: xanthine and dehydrogenase maturation factor XdhC/CoxF family-like protein [Chitinophagaceae bacterium]|nr:xanthine and dehydrogenase maturation factor XdhC/CoxF family-like protein [Chitinophagaceae bacterium]